MSRATLLYGSRRRLIEAIKKLTPKLIITSDFNLAEASIQNDDLIHIYENPLMLGWNLTIPQNISYIVIDLQGFTSLSRDLAVNTARRILGIVKGLCIAGKTKLVILSPARARIDGSIAPALPVHSVDDEVINLEANSSATIHNRSGLA
jgi:hypothetical protein